MINFACQLIRDRFKLDVSFEANQGVLALFGPSGSGKTTVLNLIAGIERPDTGRISIDGDVLVDTEKRVFVPPHKRRLGFVFQSGQLFPHLTVRRNLEYGKAFAAAGEAPLLTFDAAVDLLGIGHLIDQKPETLSGGEAQRVAIGRALLASPRALLMDEPLASLDEERKGEILPFLEKLTREIALPIVYVSHSPEEVARLATFVCRLSEGRILRQGGPEAVLRPQSLANEERLGGLSVLKGQVAHHNRDHVLTVINHPAGKITVPGIFGNIAERVQISIRPINVALATEAPSGVSIRTVLHGHISTIESGVGPYALATVELDGGDLLASYLTRAAVEALSLAPGAPVHCLIKSVSIDREGR